MKQNVIDQLRQAIRDSELTQRVIAEATGVDQGTISKFLRGDRSLSLDSFAKLCDYLRLKLVGR